MPSSVTLMFLVVRFSSLTFRGDSSACTSLEADAAGSCMLSAALAKLDISITRANILNENRRSITFLVVQMASRAARRLCRFSTIPYRRDVVGSNARRHLALSPYRRWVERECVATYSRRQPASKHGNRMIAHLLKPWSRKSLSLANGIVGRALLADPDWKLKVRDGRTKD